MCLRRVFMDVNSINITYRKRENGKWQAIISYKENGEWQQKPKGGFDLKGDAKNWAEKEKHEMVIKAKKGITDSNITLGELFDLYIDNSKMIGKAAGTVYFENTVKNFFSELWNQEVKKLTSYTVRKYISEKQEETGKSYHGYFPKLNSVLNFARKDLKIIYDNPLEGMKIKRKSEDKRIKFITAEYYEEILNSFKKKKERLLIRTAYETGMRVGELFGFTKNDIRDGYIDVNKQYYYGNGSVFGPLKTENSYRKIPITKDLEKALLEIAKDDDERIFKGVSKSTIADVLRLKFNTSLHCFRHTYSTRLISQNIDFTVVSRVVGDDIKTILKVYTQLNKDILQDEEEKIRDIFA